MNDSFTQKAFQEIEEASLEERSKAWGAFSDKFDRKQSLVFHLAVTQQSPDFIKLLDVVKNAGLTQALHDYKTCCMMYGFDGGYAAGQLSMLDKK